MTAPAAGSGSAGLAAAVDVLAARLVALYARAEQDLLASLAKVAEHGLRDTAGAAQLLMFGDMRRAAERVATSLRLQSGPLASQIAAEAAQRGDTAALALLRRIVAADPRLAARYLQRIAGTTGHAITAANAIALDLADRLDATRFRIVRYADDAYRAATAEAATRLVLGREGLTPATGQNLAWTELTRAGVTGYTDTRGRRWNLSSYVEMATRTAVQRAYNQSHQDRMASIGIGYFTVSHTGRPCPLCKPYEGAVLGANPGRVTEPSALTGAPVAFTVAATLEEARAAGFQHPNCRHVLLPYFPGVTKTGAAPSAWTSADEARYRATQQLRALERQVRSAKRAQSAALDDLAQARAGRQVRAAQARIRAHLDQHGDLIRRRRREQLNLGNR